MRQFRGAALFLAFLFSVSACYFFAGFYDSPAPVQTFLDRHGQIIGSLSQDGGLRVWTPLNAIPKPVIAATLAAEDRYFFLHPGVNPFAVTKAFFANLRRGKIVRGGSTITEQLAKTLLQERAGRVLPRSFATRLRTLVLALALETKHDKSWILERYLNGIYYGKRAYGIAAAAERYFGKALKDLDADEIAILAKLPKAPNRFAAGLLASEKAPSFDLARHYIEYVARERGFSNIHHTTLDLELQNKAEAALKNLLAERVMRDPLLNAAIVVIDVATGDVLAMVGSRDYSDAAIDGQVNVAVSLRQPGSVLKPFTYFAAFAKGLNAASRVSDSPENFALTADDDGYMPQNFDRRFRGSVTVREALANSYNVPAVDVLNRVVGLSAYHDLLKKFGFTTLSKPPLHYGLSVTLGSGEVTLLELTNAYAGLARGGFYLPYRIAADDQRQKPNAVVADADRFAAEVTRILADPDARLKTFGFNGALALDDHGVAVKTGTSYELRDNWTLGYTGKYAVGVWVGHADGSPLEGTTGATGAAPIWHAVMENLLRGEPRHDFVGSRFLPRPKLAAKQALFSQNKISRPWRIVSPLSGNRFQTHPELPARHQKIAARVAFAGDKKINLKWYLDGHRLEKNAITTKAKDSVAWLDPVPGKHTLTVRAADGASEDVTFHILVE